MTAVCPLKMINSFKGKSSISPANQGFLHSKVSFVLMMDKTDFRKVPAEARDVHSFHISYCAGCEGGRRSSRPCVLTLAIRQ